MKKHLYPLVMCERKTRMNAGKTKWKIIIPAILLILAVVLISSFFIFHDKVLDAVIALREWSKSGSCSAYTVETILQNRKVHSLLSKVSGVRRGDVCCIISSVRRGRKKKCWRFFPRAAWKGIIST